MTIAMHYPQNTSINTTTKRESRNIIGGERNGIITTSNNILDHYVRLNNPNVVVRSNIKLTLFRFKLTLNSVYYLTLIKYLLDKQISCGLPWYMATHTATSLCQANKPNIYEIWLDIVIIHKLFYT